MLMFNSRPCGAAAVLLGLAGVCLASSPAAHARQVSGATKAVPHFSMDLQDVSVREALTRLFNTAHVNFAFSSYPVGKVKLALSNQTFPNALQLILRSASPPLTCAVENGVYIVRSPDIDGGLFSVGMNADAFRPLVAAQVAPPKVTMNLHDVEMRQALENLFGQARAQYSIDSSVTGYVSLSIKDQPFTDALQTLLRASASPLTYTVENGVYLVRAAKTPPLPSGPVIAPSARQRGSIEWRGETNPVISMNLNDTNIRTVLQDLFKSARAQYSISPDVTGKVTLTMTGQTFENALRLVLRSASAPLTYTVENGVYIVKPRPDAEENTPEAIKAYARAMQKISAAFPAQNDRDVSGPFEVEVNKDKTVNITGTGPIRDLLRQLMSATNADAGYFVAPDITGDTTVLLRKLPVAQALKLTLQNVSPRVTYAKENGVYVFHTEGDKSKIK